MNLAEHLRIPAILLVCLFLSSCFETREEIWLYSDASGRADLSASIPLIATRLHGGEPGVRKIVENFLSENKAISSHQLETEVEDGELQLHLKVTFDNARDLSKISTSPGAEKLPEQVSEFFGSTKVEIQGLNIAFHRRLDLGKAIPGSAFIPRSRLRDRHITTILHLPKPALSQNATEVRNDGHTLIWKTPLATALRQPIDTRFTMPIPLPWTRIIFVAAVAIPALLMLILWIYRRRRRRRSFGKNLPDTPQISPSTGGPSSGPASSP